MNNRVKDLLEFVYGREVAGGTADRIERLIGERFAGIKPPSAGERQAGGRPASTATAAGKAAGSFPLDERDAFLITYADQFRRDGSAPLEILSEFASRYLAGTVSGIHILPFFPFTSDDGFSISDYSTVKPEFGDWRQIEDLAGSFKLMSDLVLNHCSISHRWFKSYLDDDPRYRNYFITVPDGTDLSMVVRPRALPLLTEFETKAGRRNVWTTFSTDQVDLNYGNPDVLIEMIEIFFDHVRHGIQVIRLDAIAYLWKEFGHPCIHHPKTHAIVKLFRTLAEEYAPWVVLITETNVPHEENISYFGDGNDEAHMIYQFSLPPLVLDAFLREDTGHLTSWASSLPPLSGPTTYFNFLASHDGIGLLPAHGILNEQELRRLTDSVIERGGLISYKATPSGDIPYEMNINYCDAVAEHGLEDSLRARKFLASQAFLLALVGVPGIYVHSMLGSGNYMEGVKETGRNRTINREKLRYSELQAELDHKRSFRNLVIEGYSAMLRARRRPAFHPLGKQEVIPSEKSLFVVLRESVDGRDRVLCAINTAGRAIELVVEERLLDASAVAVHRDSEEVYDIVADRPTQARRTTGRLVLTVEPWQVLWVSRTRTPPA